MLKVRGQVLKGFQQENAIIRRVLGSHACLSAGDELDTGPELCQQPLSSCRTSGPCTRRNRVWVQRRMSLQDLVSVDLGGEAEMSGVTGFLVWVVGHEMGSKVVWEGCGLCELVRLLS